MSAMDKSCGLLSILANQMVARLIVTGIRFAIAIWIISQSGVGVFGGYVLVLSILLVGETLVDFGITDWLARSLSMKSKEIGSMVLSSIKARVLLVGIGAIVMCTLVISLPGLHQYRVGVIIATLALPIYAGVLYFRSLLKARMRMDLEVFAELSGLVCTLPFYFGGFMHDSRLLDLVLCYLISRILFLFFLVVFAKKFCPRLGGSDDGKSIKSLIGEVSPLGVSMILVVIHSAVDPILVATFLDDVSTGFFAGSQRIVFLMSLLLVPLSDALLPIFSRAYESGQEVFSQKMKAGSLAFVILSGSLFCGFYSGSGFLLGLLGGEMEQVDGLFRILCVAALLKGVSLIAAPAILAAGHLNWVFKITLSLVLFKVVLLVILLSKFGLMGAAYAMVIGELLNLIICLSLVKFLSVKTMDIGILRVLGTLAVAGVSVSLISCFNYDGSFVAGVLSGMCFLILGFVFRCFGLKKLQEISNTLSSTNSEETV